MIRTKFWRQASSYCGYIKDSLLGTDCDKILESVQNFEQELQPR